MNGRDDLIRRKAEELVDTLRGYRIDPPDDDTLREYDEAERAIRAVLSAEGL